jgi:hypothetical protein
MMPLAGASSGLFGRQKAQTDQPLSRIGKDCWLCNGLFHRYHKGGST